MRGTIIAVAVALVGLMLSGFGTINHGGQSAEHEKITRRALGCPGVSPGAFCFQSATLDQLAGRGGTFGAIGYPDSSLAIFKSQAHCDDGDAVGQLETCRTWMNDHMNAAVREAAGLLDRHAIVPAQVSLFVGCVWALELKGRAKCNVLQDFGIALHAAQDFYAHTNWVDAVSANPPGLGMIKPAPFIELRQFPPRPAGLISGCFSIWGQCGDRISHAQLNKDTGPIGDVVGPGTTPRGAYFAAAVSAATADSIDKLAVLQERLVAAYGPADGLRMMCAITHDDPAKTC